jgi:hypothetical protein
MSRRAAEGAVDAEALKWLTDHDVLTVVDPLYYGLVDEFLRVRLMLDAEQTQEGRRQLEGKIIDEASIEEFAEAELSEADESYEYDSERAEKGSLNVDEDF